MSSKSHDREPIDTGAEKRYSRRDDVSRSLSQDVRKHARTKEPHGQGDRGDPKR